MICEQCNTQNSDSATKCKGCGHPLPIVAKKQGAVDSKVTHYARCALGSIVTYDVLAHALGDGKEYEDSLEEETDRLTFAIYRIAQQAFACYSHFLYHHQRPKVLVSHVRKLSGGNVADVLQTAGFPRQGAEALLKYQGIRHWLAGSILTMLFMELLRANGFSMLSDKDLVAVDMNYGLDFAEEQWCLAIEANKYVTPQTPNQDAITLFMRAHIATLSDERKRRVSDAIVDKLLEQGYKGKVKDLPSLIGFFQTRVRGLAKEYELILLIAVLKAKCEALSDFTLDTVMATH